MVTLPSVTVRPGLITRSTLTSYCPARDDDALMGAACLLTRGQGAAFSIRCDAAKVVGELRVAPGRRASAIDDGGPGVWRAVRQQSETRGRDPLRLFRPRPRQAGARAAPCSPGKPAGGSRRTVEE